VKTFVQYGAGNIGRGFLGPLFSKAGYRLVFIDVNKVFIDELNKKKRYPVRVVSNGGAREEWVKTAGCADGNDMGKAAETIAGCDIMATAVGVSALPKIARNIAEGFKLRNLKNPGRPLDILVCENLIDVDKRLFQLVAEWLDAEEKEMFSRTVGLVEASVGRMVPVMTEEMKEGNPLRVCVESYCELPVDKAAFRGELPAVTELKPFSPFEYYINRKLFVHNMGHTLIAYLGNLTGCRYIWQAVEIPAIKQTARRAMNESARALAAKFSVPGRELEEHIGDLLERFANKALGDTVERVGRDVLRKLAANDRFAGAITFCRENGVNPVYIPAGLAAGLLFEPGNSFENTGLKERLKVAGPDAVLKETCGLEGDNGLIKRYLSAMLNGANPEDILNLAESFQETAEVFS